MRLARVLATDRAKLTASAAPRGDLATDQISGDYAVAKKGCCSRCSANEESVPASKYAHVVGMSADVRHGCSGPDARRFILRREEHWNCGVCYDEICCPFSLPCGELLV